MGFVREVKSAFGEKGIFSSSKNYEFRPQQQNMAQAVAEAICQDTTLVIEAGTGVGKSLAYLLPAVKFALDNGRKAIISTHTINLQEQLFHKDIPFLKQAMGVEFNAALLKGKNNYLCQIRLQKALAQKENLFTSSELAGLKDIEKWAQTTTDGTISSLDFTPDWKIWHTVCVEHGLCFPKHCSYAQKCPYVKARRLASEANVIVMNHSMFFSLLGENMEGEGNSKSQGFIYPGDFAILDEAHTIEDVAAKQLGIHLSHDALKYDLLRLYNPKTRKGSLVFLHDANYLADVEKLLHVADEFFGKIREVLALVDESDRTNLKRIFEPVQIENTLLNPLMKLGQKLETFAPDDEGNKDEDSGSMIELAEMGKRLKEYAADLVEFLDQKSDNQVYWIERVLRRDLYNTVLESACINVAEVLNGMLFGVNRACILTSATLSAGDKDLGYFRKRIGAFDAAAVQVGSPYNLARQMQLIVPVDLPDPASEEFWDALIYWIPRALEHSNGRAFVLFTSYTLLRNVAKHLEPYLKSKGWTSLVQGMGSPRHEMLRKFKSDMHSVLFGTDSFWTGVDVPGDSLSNVIITRIPFKVPSDPIPQARSEMIQKGGGNAFMQYTLPEAILKFRQGVGRLIRSHSDHGSVFLLDSRVVQKQYGSRILDSLEGVTPIFLKKDDPLPPWNDSVPSDG